MARSKKNILNNAEISNRNEEKEINIMNKKDKEEETKVTKIDNFVAPFVSQDSLNDVKEPFDITKVEGVKEIKLEKEEENEKKSIKKSENSSFETLIKDNPISKTQKLGVNHNFNMSTTPMI